MVLVGTVDRVVIVVVVIEIITTAKGVATEETMINDQSGIVGRR